VATELRTDVSRAQEVWTISVTGELDMDTAPRLAAVLTEVTASRPSRVILEFEDVSFLDSSGIRELVTAKRDLAEQGATLVIGGMSGAVEKVLDVSGLLTELSDRAGD